ncbi:MAG: AMP-binding protein [Alphaproteobacteria bacterium]|nr:AMP-binding protein [Alphaproteobacteria bacterium]
MSPQAAIQTFSPASADAAARTTFALLIRHATARPDAVAAIDGERRLTYRDLQARVDAVAAALVARGVRRGDRVASLTPPCVEFWVLFLAVSSIGATWIGINPVYQRTEFSHVLDNAGPKLVFTVEGEDGRDYPGELRSVGLDPAKIILIRTDAEGPVLGAFTAASERASKAALDAARAAVDPEDAAVIVYTSGTTGRPKGAMLSHRAVIATAAVNAAWMGAGLEASICAAPVNHVGALNNICMSVFAYGGRIIFFPRVDIEALGALSHRENPTYLVSSPTGFMMMFAAENGAAARLNSTRLIVFGGATTPKAMLERVSGYGAAMSSVYGQTETCGIVTFTEIGASLDVMAETIGRPLPGAMVRIADADGLERPIGETGEIQVKGPYVMNGYFNMPEATAEAFTADGYLRTGDLGYQRADGNLVFVGRLKEMFKSGGYNVYPLEVETAICDHPAVEMAIVAPRPHDRFQEVGHAFIKLRAGATLDDETLREFLKRRIANYKVPKSFAFEETLPLLANGKIDRATLKRRAAALTA